MKLTIGTVRLLIESPDAFPVDLDDAWKWLGFSRKAAAKKVLLESFEKDLDFFQKTAKVTGGRPSELFMLTVDCFKSLGMMANTPKGREVRRYFLECERQLKELLGTRSPQPQSEPTPAAPKALPPASGWAQPDWDALPLSDQLYFSETPEQKAKRAAADWGDISRYLIRF